MTRELATIFWSGYSDAAVYRPRYFEASWGAVSTECFSKFPVVFLFASRIPSGSPGPISREGCHGVHLRGCSQGFKVSTSLSDLGQRLGAHVRDGRHGDPCRGQALFENTEVRAECSVRDDQSYAMLAMRYCALGQRCYQVTILTLTSEFPILFPCAEIWGGR